MPQNNLLFSNSRLIKLIIPLIIEQTLNVLVGMCDGIMVSSVGEAAISGVSLVDMINNVVLVLFAALATGGAVVTSQYLGARQMESARKSVGQLVLMAAAFGIGAGLGCYVFARPMMQLFFGSIEADVMEAGVLYLQITAMSFPFIALYNAGAAVFRSLGNSKISMKVSTLMNFINVAGNALCIYGLHMGVEGVAIPTLAARAVAAVVILWLCARPGMALRPAGEDLRRVHWDMMGRILHIGIPSACENSIFQLGRVLVVSMIALFGTYQTSANAVANGLDNVGVIIGQAVGLAMVTVVGQCVGAQDTDQAMYYIKKLMLWTYAVQGVVNAMLVIFVRWFVGLYVGLSPEAVELSVILVTIHAGFGIFLWPAAFTLPNALRAANDVRFTMVVSIASMFIWRLGFSYLLCVRLGWGATGVWIAMVIDWLCRVTCFVTRTAKGTWKTKYSAG